MSAKAESAGLLSALLSKLLPERMRSSQYTQCQQRLRQDTVVGQMRAEDASRCCHFQRFKSVLHRTHTGSGR